MAVVAGQPKERTQYDFSVLCRSFVAGGFAGMCAKSSVAPLDRIKILLQAQNAQYKHLGVVSGLKQIVRNESWLALYRGNGAQMVRIFPYAAVQFTSYEFYKSNLFRLYPNAGSSLAGLAGSMAGITSVLCTFPLDTVRARLAYQTDRKYRGIAHAFMSIYKEEGGYRALYRGLSATLVGMVPYAGMSFFSFEYIKVFFMKRLPKLTCNECQENTGGLVLTVPAKMVAGGCAGLMSQSVSYPLDVTRRRMQLAHMSPDTRHYGKSMWATLRLVYSNYGVTRGLFRGLTINYIRAVPMMAVSFSTYELAKRKLGLDTGAIPIKVG